MKESLAYLEAANSNPAIEEAKRTLQAQIEALRIEQRQNVQAENTLREDLKAMDQFTFWLRLEKPRQRRLFRQYIDKVICNCEEHVVKLRI